MALIADGVSALFIDGKPCPGSAGTFPTINPATEEVLGVAADADADDMGRAIEAARRAFDETDWSRNTELRVRCLSRQLRETMQQHLEELRDRTILEVGCPRMLTSSRPARRLPSTTCVPAQHRRVRLGTRISPTLHRSGNPTRRTVAREAVGVVGAITPWNFPHQINPRQDRPGVGGGKHRRV